jgi:superfamily II RNA helicase
LVFCRINPRRIEVDEVKRILYANPEVIISKFNSSYATLLHLYEQYQEKLYQIYPQSLHYFQQKSSRRKRAAKLIHSKMDLLKELNYIRDGALTKKGMFAQAIYGYELPLAEVYAQNILEQLSQVELAILAAALVYEPRLRDEKPKIGRNLRRLKEATDEVSRTIRRLENRQRIWPKSKEFFYHLANVTEAWLRGTDFSKLGQYCAADEGELVRYFRMTVQILREIQHAPGVSAMLKEKVRNILPLFSRDIVDAEKQLRIK